MYQIFTVSPSGLGSSPVATVRHGRNLLRSLRRACSRTRSCCAAFMPTPFGTYWLCMAPSEPAAAFLFWDDEWLFSVYDMPDFVVTSAHLYRSGCAFDGEYICGTSAHLASLFPFRVTGGLY